VPPEVRVHLLPALIQCPLTNGAAVAIDLLRASTTIVHALAAGAVRVIPTLTIEEACDQREALRDTPRVLLAGERAGVRIEGFDLGNSPAEFTPARVAGTTIIFTTTNGTKAILASREARRVLVGCFANLSAVEAALAHEQHVHLVCSGTNSEPTLEDTLFAGALAARLARRGFAAANDQALLALEAWNAMSARPEGLLGALRVSRGGRNLARINLIGDIEECARIDTRPLVPELIDGSLVPA
jgi:2-phosphosulfolactate phosphatase